MPVMDDIKIIQTARRYARKYGVRDPESIAHELGIIINEADFPKLKGVYMIIQRNSFIFIKRDLDPVMRRIVIFHELGHHALHRRETKEFRELNLFADMSAGRMEYEANLFAAELSLPDDEILEYIYEGRETAYIAAAMESDINLVSLKVKSLNKRGHDFRLQEYYNKFLK